MCETLVFESVQIFWNLKFDFFPEIFMKLREKLFYLQKSGKS